MWDAVGGLPVGSAHDFVAGGVGNIGTVLRIDEKKVVAVHARPFDPAVGDEIDLFLSTVPYMSFPTDTPASTRFDAVLERAYEFKSNLFAGNEIAARSLPSLGSGIVDNRDDNRDFLQRLHFEGRDWRVFVGDQFDQFESFFEVWPGKAGAPRLGRDDIEVPLEDIGKRFDQPAQTDLYTPGFEPYVVFDGSNDEIDFGDNLDRGTGGLTIGTAFRTTTGAQNASLYTKKSGTGSAAGFALNVGSGGAIRLDLGDGTDGFTINVVPAGGYDSGDRIGVIGRVQRSTDTAFLYFNLYDGNGWQLVGTVDITALDSLDNANSLFAGRDSSAGGRFFVGDIERLVMSGAAGTPQLTAVQDAIDERFADDVDPAPFIHYVPLTENFGTSVADTSSSAVDGTINGQGTQGVWSGTTEGTPDLDGVIKPQAFGQPFHTQPDLIDGRKYVWRMHDGPIDAVLQVWESGAPIPIDNTVVSDIFTGPGPVPGDAMVDLSRGLLRLGSPLAQGTRLTVTLRGDNSPSWTDSPTEILRRIANRKLGIPDPQGFEQEAFDEFDDSRGVSLYNSHREGMSFAQAFDRLMRPRSWWAIGRTGLVTVGQLSVSTIPDTDIGDDDIVAGTLRRVALPPVHWRDRVGHARIWTVQNEGELLEFATPQRIAILSQALRFVSEEDLNTRDVLHLDSIDMEWETELRSKGDARLELADLRDMFAQRTEVWEMQLATGILQFWLGDSVRMKTTRYNLLDRVFYVVGVEENINTGVRLTVWGPAT